MDFVFTCRSCSGPLVASLEFRGRMLRCAHCAAGTSAPMTPEPIDESLISSFLDHAGGDAPRLLRRARLAAETPKPQPAAPAVPPPVERPRPARVAPLPPPPLTRRHR